RWRFSQLRRTAHDSACRNVCFGMAHYRIYVLTPDDHIDFPPYGIECASDIEASRQAERLLGDYPAAEIWCGARLVGRVSQSTAEPNVDTQADRRDRLRDRAAISPHRASDHSEPRPRG